MLRSRNIFAGASCVVLTFASFEATAQTTPAQQPAGEGSTAVAEVIVTASRRSENIRDVPTAVSAFGEARLRETQVSSLEDLTAITPNFEISSQLTSANITIRGIGNGNFTNAGTEPGAAVHQNGVYVGQPALALATFLDVERVEVLRGPQGTLFGRNATGGAVNIIPNAPTAELAYGFDVTAGVAPTMFRSSGHVSGPMDGAGRVLGRLSVGQDYNEGFTKNLQPEKPSRLDDNNDVAVRGQLTWLPTDTVDVRLLLEYQTVDDAGPAAFLAGNASGTTVVFPVPGAPIALGPGAPIGDPEAREVYANLGSRYLDAKNVDLIANWAVGGGNLRATLSHRETYIDVSQDGDGTGIPFTATNFTNDADQEYSELLYTSDDTRRFSYVLGVNAYDEHFEQDITIPTLGYPVLYEAGGVVDTRSYAAFGHAEYKLTPATEIFGGARYSYDRKSMGEYLNYRAFFGLPTTNTDEESWSEVTYDLGVTHAFSRLVTGYAKYATGYKSGGFSVNAFTPAFEPETNTSLEAGLKGTFLEGRLQANVAAFRMKYNELQINQVVDLSSVVTNAAKATVDGLELEAVLRPIAGLRIEVTGAYLDARFDEFDTLDPARPALGVLNLEGNALPRAPEFAGSVGVFNDFDVPSGTLTLGARYNWKDRIFFTEFNVPAASQEATGRIDLFLNYRNEEGRWSASVFALNATDEQIKSNVFVVSALLGSLAGAQYQPGRQIGVSLGYRF